MINELANLLKAAIELGETDHCTERISSSADGFSLWTITSVNLGAGPRIGFAVLDIYFETSLGLPTVADRPIL